VSTTEFIDALRHRGITLLAVKGKLFVRPSPLLTNEDRDAIRGNVMELVAALAAERQSALEDGVEVTSATWDQSVALRLMFDADTLVEQLAVDGRHPEIAAAAARVCDAHLARDARTLHQALSEFEMIVRRVHSSAGA
jgi:hypothetical protein